MIKVTERPRIVNVRSSMFPACEGDVLKLTKFADLTTLSTDDVPGDIDARGLINFVNGFDGIIASVAPNYTREVLENCPRLKIISRTGIGFSNVDTEAATELGIPVSIVPGIVEKNAVAELAVGLAIAQARHFFDGSTALATDNWKLKGKMYGAELSNKAVGIIGLGNIGSRTAQILKHGFNCTVAAYDPHIADDVFKSDGIIKVEKLQDLLRASDFIFLHCPHNSETDRILGRKEFEAMKNSAIIINTARGGLVDSEAVIWALDNKKIAGYATDVYVVEPTDSSNPLVSRSDIATLPHLGGNSWESRGGISGNNVADLEAVFVRGELPERLANPEVSFSPALRIHRQSS